MAEKAPPTEEKAQEGPQGNQEGSQAPKLYRKPRPLHLKDHAALKVKTPRDYSMAREMALAPINVGEFVHASANYPILFSGDKVPVPVAALGLAEGSNLFVGADGAWRPATYVPGFLQRYPFLTARVPAEGDQPPAGEQGENSTSESKRVVLLIDEESPVITEGEGEALVIDGKPSEMAQRAMKFCESYNQGIRETRAFSQVLLEQGLFTQRDVNLALPGGGRVSMHGLNLLDARKLRDVADDVFLNWRRRGWILAIHAQLLSEHRWRDLGELARKNEE